MLYFNLISTSNIQCIFTTFGNVSQVNILLVILVRMPKKNVNVTVVVCLLFHCLIISSTMS